MFSAEKKPISISKSKKPGFTKNEFGDFKMMLNEGPTKKKSINNSSKVVAKIEDAVSTKI